MAFNRESFAHFWEHINTLLGKKVDKVNGKSLIADSEIARLATVTTGLEVSDTEEELEEGTYITNADQLGGINASEYAKKNEVVTSVNGRTGAITINEIAYIDVTIYPDENGDYIFPSQVTSENFVNILLQSWATTSWPGYYLLMPSYRYGVFKFNIIGFGYNSNIDSTYHYLLGYDYGADDAANGVNVRIWYKV